MMTATESVDVGAVDRLAVKLARVRVYVPPHPRVRLGKLEHVDGYWMDYDAAMRAYTRAVGDDRDVLRRAVGIKPEGADPDLEERDAPVEDFGLLYAGDVPEVEAAKGFEGWDDLPVENYDLSEPLYATEPTLESRAINKVLSGIAGGQLSFRENYYVRLVRANGKTFVVDGHHRVAMYKALGRSEMPVQVLDLGSL